MDKHNGQITEYIVRKNGYNISDLARALQINRRSCYNWFQQKDLPPPNIRKIGNVIRHDFSKEFPEYFVSADFAVLEQPDLFISRYYGADKTNNWQKKYQTLLNDFNNYLRSIKISEFADEKVDKPGDDL